MAEAAIGAGASVLGGFLQNRGANQAQNSQEQAAQAAIGEQRRQYDQSRQDQTPYMQFGQGAGGLGGLQALANGDYSGLFNSPEFKARTTFANQQFNDGAAAKFRLFSGGAQNDRDELNQNLAATGLGQLTSHLQWGAGLGQNAASGVGNLGAMSANQIGGQYGQIGQAGQQGAYDRTNAWGGALSGLSQGLSSYFGGR